MTITEMRVHMDCAGCETNIRKAIQKTRWSGWNRYRHSHAESNSDGIARPEKGSESSEEDRKKSRAVAVPLQSRILQLQRASIYSSLYKNASYLLLQLLQAWLR
ncbi:hypothetical protein OIU84_002552 [Salix udensis]|uniref:HMA domain-containing protein n=1 Tax=Salix udensis TaxID=889485 RepID=A0AAD6K4J5_9ROSI|nr:hypothetical protein OIU84_002552 [Salix udensis]